MYGLNPIFPHIINSLEYTPESLGKVLDVGCGGGTFGVMLRSFRSPESITGIDAFQPYIERCASLGIYNNLEQMDIKKGLPFDTNKFDNVYCIEVIEHLEYSDALFIIEELIRVGKRIVITTPTFFFKQPEIDGNPYQLHLSKIPIKYFKKRGFQVRGIGATRYIPIHSWQLASIIPFIHRNIIAVYEGD